MKAIFSQACDFGGMIGHGLFAAATAQPFFERGFLEKFICLTHRKDLGSVVKDVPLGFFQKNALRALSKMGLMQQSHVLFDNSFDLLASRMVSSCDVFFGWQHQSLYSLRKAKLLGAKTFLENPTVHIQEFEAILKEETKSLEMKQKPMLKTLVKKILKEYTEVDFIVVLSDSSADSFIERGFPKEKIIVVPAGADLKKFKPREKKGGKFIVAFVGQISFPKGVHYLLEAWQQLKLPSAELWLCGNVRRDSIKLFEKYRGNDSIKFLGFVDPAEVLPQCDAFVMPSLQDGFCIAAVEAMACSLPVIVSENTGAKDLVKEGKNGFVVGIRNTNALKEKIGFLYNNREKCKRMGKSARQTALQYDLNERGNILLRELDKRGLVK